MSIEPKTIGSYLSVDAAWRSMLRELITRGKSVPGTSDSKSIGSQFRGQPRACRELIGISLSISNPRDRLTQSRARPVAPAFLLANVLWTASGSDSLEMIEHFNRRGRYFSDDGKTLAGPPGKRIFGQSFGNQFEECQRLLNRDPQSRRAVLALYVPSDAGSHYRDCPCILHMQFLLREGFLHCITGVRSQSAAMVFPYDAFLISMLHESMAVTLKAELGSLFFNFGSLHYYEDEHSLVEAVAAETPSPTWPMPPMPEPIPSCAADLLNSRHSFGHTCNAQHTVDVDAYWHLYVDALNHSVLRQSGDDADARLPNNLRGTCYDALFR